MKDDNKTIMTSLIEGKTGEDVSQSKKIIYRDG